MNASTFPPFTFTSRNTPRSATVRTGISGSTTAAAASQARERSSASVPVVSVATASPSRVRIGALQELQLGQNMTEVLAVTPRAAAGLHPFALRHPQSRFAEDRGERALPNRPDARAIGRDAGADQILLDRVDLEHLAGVRPKLVERVLCTAATFLCSVAEPDGPLA